MKEKTFIITGSQGFIGHHLSNRIAKNGDYALGIPREQLYDPEKLREALEGLKPDYIILAHAYGNMGHQKDPEQIFHANVVATWNLLNVTKDIPIKGFINVGSSSEYGQKHSVMKESDLPEGDTFYAATKIAGTYLAKAFATQYQKPIVTIRPFSVYGEGEADFRLIPTMIKHMLDKTTMPFVSWPEHDWIMIDDFIDGLLLVLDNSEKLAGQVVNIGTGHAVKNTDIARTMSYIAETGIKTEETYQEQPHHSPTWVADNTLLRSLGWSQKVTLEQGLKRCWDYYKQKYDKRA